MYLYNISIIVEESQHDKFANWLKEEWFAQFANAIKLLKMLNSPHEGHTYCIQMMVQEQEDIIQFQQTHLLELQQQITAKYNEKVFIFDSVMQYL